MARFRHRPEPPAPGVRVVLAAKYRARAGRIHPAGEHDVLNGVVSHFRRLAERLEADEPVELSAWELPGPHRFSPHDRVRLEADGSVVLVQPEPDRRRWWAALDRSVDEAT